MKEKQHDNQLETIIGNWEIHKQDASNVSAFAWRGNSILERFEFHIGDTGENIDFKLKFRDLEKLEQFRESIKYYDYSLSEENTIIWHLKNSDFSADTILEKLNPFLEPQFKVKIIELMSDKIPEMLSYYLNELSSDKLDSELWQNAFSRIKNLYDNRKISDFRNIINKLDIEHKQDVLKKVAADNNGWVISNPAQWIINPKNDVVATYQNINDDARIKQVEFLIMGKQVIIAIDCADKATMNQLGFDKYVDSTSDILIRKYFKFTKDNYVEIVKLVKKLNEFCPLGESNLEILKNLSKHIPKISSFYVSPQFGISSM